MNIIKLTQEDINRLYPVVFEKVFGYWQPNQFPQHVIVAMREDELIGFASGFYTHQDVFHIQYVGLAPDHRGRGMTRLFNNVEQHMPARIYTAHIPQGNVIPQRYLLGNGYYVMGIRAVDGILYIEFMKESSDGAVRPD